MAAHITHGVINNHLLSKTTSLKTRTIGCVFKVLKTDTITLGYTLDLKEMQTLVLGATEA